jgi:hypothetical protein
MNYLLLANNKKISELTINKLKLNPENDVLVLFNFLIPMKFDAIQYYPNKICISRRRPIKDRLESKYLNGVKEYYVNIGIMKQLQNLFKKIYVLPCPNNMGKNTQEYEDHISLYNFDTEKLGCIDYAMNDLNKKLNYFRSGIQAEVSTGIIVYEYFKTIKLPEDNIILVAFDSGVSKFHDKDWETQYFLNEINNNYCYTIDSYGITNFTFSDL